MISLYGRRAIGCVLVCTALVALVVLAAGCGGGSKAPSVASLGTTTSNGASSAASSSRGFSPPPGGGFGGSMSMQVGTGAAGVKYSACMRSHEVPNYPDPDAKGDITITSSPALNPSSPVFQKAQGECQHLIPAGKAPSQAQWQRIKEGVLAFAACMRSHGVPNYPDPTFSNGGVSQGYNARSGISQNSPIFQAAQKTCQSSHNGGPSGGS